MGSKPALTILHLSDLQFGKNHLFGRTGLLPSDVDMDTLQHRIKEDLSYLIESYKLAPDLVVITGDISEWGRESEFKVARQFIDTILGALGLTRARIAIIPGNHDINRDACRAYFSTCAADEIEPKRPYWPKFKYFAQFFNDFFRDVPGRVFREDQPWSLFEIPELQTVLVGMNSAMAESHEDKDHYGYVGQEQMLWFLEKLKEYKSKGWLRIGVVHHNLESEQVGDEEYLRDQTDLKRVLGPYLNLILHGHTHNGKISWVSQHLPVISTGSAGVKADARPDEVPNQYQVIQIFAREMVLYARSYDLQSKRWIGDTRVTEDGSQWVREEGVTLESVHGVFPKSTYAQTIAKNNPKHPVARPAAEIDAFVAFAAPQKHQGQIHKTLTHALEMVHGLLCQIWVQSETTGYCFMDTIHSKLRTTKCFVADITFPNINLIYEVGYALSKGQKILLLKNRSLASANQDENISRSGVFESLTVINYENSKEVSEAIETIYSIETSSSPVEEEINIRVPVYVIEKNNLADDAGKLISYIKKTIHYFRSFDPTEQIRLSIDEAMRQVGQSIGVVIQFAGITEENNEVTNYRAALIAGIAAGMDKVSLLLHPADGPISKDYRHAVSVYDTHAKLESHVRSFADTIARKKVPLSQIPYTPVGDNLLSSLNLGSSCAENEFQELGQYYLKTYEFERALRGDVRLVVGRKGSGKTALFGQVRDKIRSDKKCIVIDLKPDGFQIRKFNEQVLDYLEAGTREHTITAFWEYLLLLESCYKILEKDERGHFSDTALKGPYEQLAGLYRKDSFQTADFSERMSRLIENITDNYARKHRILADVSDLKQLSRSQITEFLYSHDVKNLRQSVANYLKMKKGLWILFDNLDKGWSTHGLTRSEALSIRCLLDAARKLQQDLHRLGVDCHALIFIRNDVYDWIIEETPDRGKESTAELDWKEADDLRELLRKRFIYSGMSSEYDFTTLWTNFCTPSVDGMESSQYLIERSLMRPRFLLDLLALCRSTAINRGHRTIEPDDIRKAFIRYSKDIVFNINFEIEDVFPKAKKLLYCFQNRSPVLSKDHFSEAIAKYELADEERNKLLEILLWQGVFGVLRDGDASVLYIYSVQYDIHRLNGIIQSMEKQKKQISFYINPAFWPHLEIV